MHERPGRSRWRPPQAVHTKGYLHFNFDIDARRQVQSHEVVNGLRIRIDNIDQALMDPHFELIARILINKARLVDGVTIAICRERDWTGEGRTTPFDGVDNLLRRLIHDFVIVRLDLDADPLLFFWGWCSHGKVRESIGGYLMILRTTPAPTVFPPSRMAKRIPCSIATGAPSLILILIVSPGMTISVPSGSSISPVTSVVRM